MPMLCLSLAGGKIQLSTINSQLVMIPHPIAYSFTLHSSKAIAERNNRQVFWLILFRFLPNRVAPYQWIICERHLGSFLFQVSSFRVQVLSFRKQVTQLQDVDLQQRVCYGFSPYSLLNQGVTPDTYYSLFKTVCKDTTFLWIMQGIERFFILFAYIWLFQKKTVSLHSETKLSIDWPNYNSS